MATCIRISNTSAIGDTAVWVTLKAESFSGTHHSWYSACAKGWTGVIVVWFQMSNLIHFLGWEAELFPLTDLNRPHTFNSEEKSFRGQEGTIQSAKSRQHLLPYFKAKIKNKKQQPFLWPDAEQGISGELRVGFVGVLVGCLPLSLSFSLRETRHLRRRCCRQRCITCLPGPFAKLAPSFSSPPLQLIHMHTNVHRQTTAALLPSLRRYAVCHLTPPPTRWIIMLTGFISHM